MGFMDAMKGANMNYGTVDSPYFPACYLAKKDDHFMITGAQIETYEFSAEDLVEFSVVASGNEWVKYKMVFADGTMGILTSPVAIPGQKKGTVSMAPIERFFGHLL